MDGILNISVLVLGLISTLVFLVLYFTKLKSKQLLNYLPNVWTSLGILGTFIAIVYSLNDLQEQSKTQENKKDEYIIESTNQIIPLDDSQRDDKKNTEINVYKLIEDIAPAFITSIIGILGAILTSILIKIIYAIEEKKEERIYTDTVGGNIPPELMLYRINRSIEKLITVTTLQESNIKSFLDNYMLQLDAFYNKIFESNKEQVQTLSDEYVHSVAHVLAGANEEINKRTERTDWFKVKAEGMEVKINLTQAAQKSTAQIETVTVEHDVYENDVKGMKIHLKFSVQNMKGFKGRCVAYMYYEDGTPLKDTNGSYRTTDGQCSFGKDFTPSYDRSTFNDFVIFVPLKELEADKGEHNMKFSCTIWDKSSDSSTSIAHSDYYSFTLTKK